jgi:hypothetical protein
MFILAGFALTVAYFVAPDGWPKAVLYDAVSLGTALAIVVGVRRYRPRRRVAWYALAVGQLLFFGGDVLWNVYELVLQESPFPSLADVLYLAGYPALMGGLAIMVRSRLPGGDRGSFLDALIVTTGLGLISWIFLVQIRPCRRSRWPSRSPIPSWTCFSSPSRSGSSRPRAPDR